MTRAPVAFTVRQWLVPVLVVIASNAAGWAWVGGAAMNRLEVVEREQTRRGPLVDEFIALKGSLEPRLMAIDNRLARIETMLDRRLGALPTLVQPTAATDP